MAKRRKSKKRTGRESAARKKAKRVYAAAKSAYRAAGRKLRSTR